MVRPDVQGCLDKRMLRVYPWASKQTARTSCETVVEKTREGGGLIWKSWKRGVE